MEYWRRCSLGPPGASTTRRRVNDWPGVKSNSPDRSSGTSKVTATASSVSSSTSATVRVWNAAAAATQISLTCSNGSRQSEQR
jgi:hypothetical protein